MRHSPLWIALLTIIVTGCTSPQSDSVSSYLPNSVGQIDEVLVVTDSTYWNGKTGKVLKKVLTENFAVLPQPEPTFTVRYQPVSTFEGIFRKYRNILIVTPTRDNSLTKQLLQTTVGAKKLKSHMSKGFHLFTSENVWAHPQQLTFIVAPTQDSLQKGVVKHGGRLVDHIHQFENQEIKDQLEHRPKNQALIDSLRFYYQLSLPVPKPYEIITSKPYFTWLRYVEEEQDLTILNLVIYTAPYNKQEDFKIQNIIDRRNRFLGKFITGGAKGSHMMTDSIMPVAYKQLTLNNQYAIELKGLWRLTEEFMGGPFVSYSIYDTHYDRILTLEGFVYAPGKKKRAFIRELSVLLRSFTIIKPDSAQQPSS